MAAAAPQTLEPAAPSGIEAALAAQRKFMDIYGDSLEQMLGILVYLVPVQDAEEDAAGFWNQAVYSVIDLFNLYRNVALRSPEALPIAIADEQHLKSARLTYTAAAFSMRALRAVQVLIEMHAARVHGTQHALRVCLRVEVVKLLLKLLMRSRMPFAFYIDEDALEQVEPPRGGLHSKSPFSAPSSLEAPSSGVSSTSGNGEPIVGRRSGRTLRALVPSGDDAAAGAPAAAGPPSIVGLREDSSRDSPSIRAGELLFHTRPLLHLLVLLRRGQRSWAAWLVAFVVDRIALALVTPEARPRPNSRAATLEFAELRRRQFQMWWALARSPVFEKLLQRPVELLNSIWKRIPVINLFNVVELALALQPFYFSTSAS